MSGTIQASVVKDSGSATNNLTLDTGGNATVGNTLVMGSSFLRNRIINGDMRISQRGTSFSTPTAGAYTLDRWAVGWVGAAPASVAQVSGPASFKNALQITGAASNTVVNTYQRIESLNCTDLSGATVTIQANILVSSAQTVAWYLQYPTASDNYASVTTISNGTWSATTTATTFTATITNLPSSALNGLQLIISPNNAGAFTSGTIAITGVQLEVGTVATPFERQIYSTQLAQCQRYAYKSIGSTSTYCYFPAFGQVDTTTSAQFVEMFPVPMRSSTALALTTTGTAANYYLYTAGVLRVLNAVPAIGAVNASVDASQFSTAVASAVLVAGNATQLLGVNASSAYLLWTSEL